MPTYELKSPQTGQTYQVDFDREPSHEDVDEAAAHFDKQWWDAQGTPEETRQQGPAGTFGMSVPQTFAKTGTGSIQGTAGLVDRASKASSIFGAPARLLATALTPALNQAAGVASDLEDTANQTYPTNPANPKAQVMGSGLAQGMTLLAGGAVGKAAGLGNAALTTLPLASGALSGAHEGMQKAQEIGVESPEGQMAMGLLFGGIEAGTEKLFGLGNKAATEAMLAPWKKTAGQMLKDAAKSIGGEASEEVIAGSAQDLLTRAFAMEDPNRPGYTTTGVELPKLDRKMLERRGLEALGGAAGGTIFAGVEALNNRNAPPPLPAASNQETTDDNVSPNETAGAAAPDQGTGNETAPPPMGVVAGGQAVMNADPGVAGLEEHTGDLTAEEVADLEGGGQPGPNLFANKPRFPTGGLLDKALNVATGQERGEMSAAVRGFLTPEAAAPSAAPLGQGAGRGAGAIFQPQAQASLQDAYHAATAGESTAWLPLWRVFQEAQKTAPGLQPQDFLNQVRAAYDNGQVMLEGANSQQEVQAAQGWALHNVGNGVGVGIRMAVPQGQPNLFANQGGREVNESRLSDELQPGNLPGDVTAPADFTPAEAQARVDELSRSLAAGGQLRGRLQPISTAPGKLSEPVQRALEFGKAFAGLFGRRVVALEGLTENDWGGVANASIKDTVFWNPKRARAVDNLVGHELFHHLEMEHQDLFDQLDAVLAPELQDLESARKQYAGYKTHLDKRREIYADLLGESIHDPQFWDRMARREPGIFAPLARAVLQWFGKVINALKARGWSASPYFKNLEKAQDVLAQAMVEFARRHHGMQPREAVKAVRDAAVQKDNFMQGATGRPNETQSRFASPNGEGRGIDGPRTDETVSAEAKAWLDSMTPEQAVMAFEQRRGLPPLDTTEHAAGQLIAQLSGMASHAKTEVQRVWAHVQAQKMARVWTQEYLSADPARALRARAVVNNTVLGPIAPVLAAQEVLADRAKKVIDARFDGGADGAAKSLQKIGEDAGNKAGDTLAAQLNAERLMQEITAGWQRLMQEMQQAKSDGGAAMRGTKTRLASMRDAARQRLAAKQQGRQNAFADAPVQDRDEAIIGAAVMADGVVDFEQWKTAVQRELGAQSLEDLLQTYREAMGIFYRELRAENKAKRAKNGKPQEEDAEAADDSLESDEEVKMRAERRASQLIYKTEERLRQGSKDLQGREAGGDTINRAFREQVTSPMNPEAFAARLEKLNVGGDVAARLFQTAAREAQDRTAMAVYRAERGREARASKQASELIYRTEEKLRQGSKDLQPAAHGDSINRAFRDQVRAPVSEGEFADRLKKLGVPAEMAGRLHRTAAREAADQVKVKEYNAETAARALARNQPALAKMLSTLRGKMYPGMKWQDVFAELPSAQKARQREIYKRLMQDERLRNLTPQDRLALTNELDKSWQKERQKVFKRELKKAGVIKEKKAVDREKVAKAAPRLLRLMNLGMLNSEMFREALAKEYGVKVIDAQAAAELTALSERVQNAPDGVPRRKLEVQMMERLQQMTDSTWMQLLESYWTASVLSGWRTQVDIGLGLANGIEDVGLGSLVTALRTGQRDVAWQAITKLITHVPTALGEAWDHMLTGNKTLMRNAQIEAQQALEDGNRLSGDAGAELWRKGGWRKVPGAFMIFYSRLLAALDHINSTSTAEGAKMMALARHPELYRKAMIISPADRVAAQKQAQQEMLGGREPQTSQERLEVKARVKELLDKEIPTEVIHEAREIGRQAALQGDPTGLGYGLMYLVNALVGAPKHFQSIVEKNGVETRTDRLIMHALRVASTVGRVATGTKFVRTVAHSINRTFSYAPGIGLIRLREGGLKRSGAQQDILIAKQITGTLVGLVMYTLLAGRDDDESGIEAGWKSLTPQQKAQLYAQKKQPYSIWWRDSSGRVVSFNYQQWGVAGILATLGSMEDERRYNKSKKGDMNTLINGITRGMMSWTDKAQLQGLQTVFDGSVYNADPGASLASRLNKFLSQTGGGFFPRIGKDIDAVAHPALHDTSEWWMKWAQQVPMVREMSSGKRVDIFGKEVELDRTPLSRVVQLGTADPAYRTLGLLNQRDLWLPDPSTGERVVKMSDGQRRQMTASEKDRYQRRTGEAYREYILNHGQELLRMDAEKARDKISRATKQIRDVAIYKATH